MEKNIKKIENQENGTLVSYITGFVLSALLTIAGAIIVNIHISSEHSVISHAVLIPTVLALAFVQLIVQLIFFLRLGSGAGGRWKAAIFFSTLILVLIIVIGSIWIMDHLNYNMTPAEMSQYMQDQQGF